MGLIRTVAFDISPEQWDSLERGEVREPVQFELSNGIHEMSGELLRLLDRPRVLCRVDEDQWIQ